jgi:hypothetical protein
MFINIDRRYQCFETFFSFVIDKALRTTKLECLPLGNCLQSSPEAFSEKWGPLGVPANIILYLTLPER